MTLALALTCGMLFGAGAFLLLKRDLIRDVAGMILVSNSVNLFVMAAGISRGAAPIYPLESARSVSDPLVQALTLTALVISFGVSALLLSLVYGIYASHGTIDQDELRDAEWRDEHEREREDA
ncbi:MAG: sodium:proton antiporter [Candidatus Rokuibacteriota bacterium]